MPNNHSTEYELNSTSHETRKSFNFNDPRINDTSGTNFESRKARRGIYLSFDVVIQGKKDLRQRSSQFDSYWWDPLSKKRVKKRKKSFDFLEERERDKNERSFHGYWRMTLAPFQTEFFSSWYSRALLLRLSTRKRKICVFFL